MRPLLVVYLLTSVSSEVLLRFEYPWEQQMYDALSSMFLGPAFNLSRDREPCLEHQNSIPFENWTEHSTDTSTLTLPASSGRVMYSLVMSETECARLCLRNTTCRSASYESAAGKCIVNCELAVTGGATSAVVCRAKPVCNEEVYTRSTARAHLLLGFKALFAQWDDLATSQFRKAQLRDPSCVMAYWGEATVHVLRKRAVSLSSWRTELGTARAILSRLPAVLDVTEDERLYIKAVQDVSNVSIGDTGLHAYKAAMLAAYIRSSRLDHIAGSLQAWAALSLDQNDEEAKSLLLQMAVEHNHTQALYLYLQHVTSSSGTLDRANAEVAVSSARRLLDTEPHSPTAHTYAAGVHSKLGDVFTAISFANDSLSLLTKWRHLAAPSNNSFSSKDMCDATEILCRNLIQTGQVEEARRLIRNIRDNALLVDGLAGDIYKQSHYRLLATLYFGVQFMPSWMNLTSELQDFDASYTLHLSRDPVAMALAEGVALAASTLRATRLLSVGWLLAQESTVIHLRALSNAISPECSQSSYTLTVLKFLEFHLQSSRSYAGGNYSLVMPMAVEAYHITAGMKPVNYVIAAPSDFYVNSILSVGLISEIGVHSLRAALDSIVDSEAKHGNSTTTLYQRGQVLLMQGKVAQAAIVFDHLLEKRLVGDELGLRPAIFTLLHPPFFSKPVGSMQPDQSIRFETAYEWSLYNGIDGSFELSFNLSVRNPCIAKLDVSENWIQVPGHFLPMGNRRLISPAYSVEWCLAACQTETSFECLSIDFGYGRCFLSSIRSKSNLVPNADVAYYEKPRCLVSDQGTNARSQFMLGLKHLFIGDTEGAVFYFRKAQKLDSLFAMAFWGEAFAAFTQSSASQTADSSFPALRSLVAMSNSSLMLTEEERVYVAAFDGLFNGSHKVFYDTLQVYANADPLATAIFADITLQVQNSLMTSEVISKLKAWLPSSAGRPPAARVPAAYIFRLLLDESSTSTSTLTDLQVKALSSALVNTSIGHSVTLLRMRGACRRGQWAAALLAAQAGADVTKSTETQSNPQPTSANGSEMHDLEYKNYALLQLGRFGESEKLLASCVTDKSSEGQAMASRMYAVMAMDRIGIDDRLILSVPRARTASEVCFNASLDACRRYACSEAAAAAAQASQSILQDPSIAVAIVSYDVAAQRLTAIVEHLGAAPEVKLVLALSHQIKALLSERQGSVSAALASLRMAHQMAEAYNGNLSSQGAMNQLLKPFAEHLADMIVRTRTSTLFEEAGMLYRSVLKVRPNRAATLLGLARLHRIADDAKKAEIFYSQVLHQYSLPGGDSFRARNEAAAFLGKEQDVNSISMASEDVALAPNGWMIASVASCTVILVLGSGTALCVVLVRRRRRNAARAGSLLLHVLAAESSTAV